MNDLSLVVDHSFTAFAMPKWWGGRVVRIDEAHSGVFTHVYRRQHDGSREDLRGRPKRDRYPHSGSAPWFAFELKVSVQLEHAFSHIDQT